MQRMEAFVSERRFEAIQPEEMEIICPFLREVPVKVGTLAKALGLTVTKATLGPKVSGLIQPSETAPSGYEIKVNRYELPERQRFTIAHEIAHYLLHREHIGRGIVDNVLYRSNLGSRIETEANQLAAEIIMPRALVRDRIKEEASSIDNALAENLAQEFRVSTPAMRVRLGLGL